MTMRVAVTRPQVDGERTASVLRARGHEVLVAPLMQVETINVDLSGAWSAIVVTSANAPGVVQESLARDTLIKLPLYAVGKRSADAARAAGFADVISADGDVGDLVPLIIKRRGGASSPLLYLAGEDRSADLIGELAKHGIAAEMRVVYRAVTAPLPGELVEALKGGEIDAVLHYSRRSADNYLAGARRAGIAEEAIAVRHVCLSENIATPLVAAGATRVAIAARPDEAALIELLEPLRG
jgi:uroporphyrinogen-III synthase